MQKPFVYTSNITHIMSHKASFYRSCRKAEATFLTHLITSSGLATPA